jgi:hypothetical protein
LLCTLTGQMRYSELSRQEQKQVRAGLKAVRRRLPTEVPPEQLPVLLTNKVDHAIEGTLSVPALRWLRSADAELIREAALATWQT